MDAGGLPAAGHGGGAGDAGMELAETSLWELFPRLGDRGGSPLCKACVKTGSRPFCPPLPGGSQLICRAVRLPRGNAVGQHPPPWHGSPKTDGQTLGQVFSVVFRFLGIICFENTCVCLLLSSKASKSSGRTTDAGTAGTSSLCSKSPA